MKPRSVMEITFDSLSSFMRLFSEPDLALNDRAGSEMCRALALKGSLPQLKTTTWACMED